MYSPRGEATTGSTEGSLHLSQGLTMPALDLSEYPPLNSSTSSSSSSSSHFRNVPSTTTTPTPPTTTAATLKNEDLRSQASFVPISRPQAILSSSSPFSAPLSSSSQQQQQQQSPSSKLPTSSINSNDVVSGGDVGYTTKSSTPLPQQQHSINPSSHRPSTSIQTTTALYTSQQPSSLPRPSVSPLPTSTSATERTFSPPATAPPYTPYTPSGAAAAFPSPYQSHSYFGNGDSGDFHSAPISSSNSLQSLNESTGGGGSGTNSVSERGGGFSDDQHRPQWSGYLGSGERRTLWLGELDQWMDEAYLRQMCSLMGWDIVSIKLVRAGNSPTTPLGLDPIYQNSALGGASTDLNYCFITFPTAHLASRILHTLTPTPTNPPIIMPNSLRPFKVNWALGSTSSPLPARTPPPLDKEFSIFVGDLAPDVSESDLVRLFLNPPQGGAGSSGLGGIRRSFSSTKSAKIMTDPITGSSRGYGFVRFTDEADQHRAIQEMQGVYCLTRPMRISHATAKNRSGSSSNFTPLSAVFTQNISGPPQHQQTRSGDLNSSDSSDSLSRLLPSGAVAGDNSISKGATVSKPPPPPPPPPRTLSPNTITYLNQLAAANGGTLPFGPNGLSFPPLPSQPPSRGSKNGDGSDTENSKEGEAQQQSASSEAQLPSLYQLEETSPLSHPYGTKNQLPSGSDSPSSPMITNLPHFDPSISMGANSTDPTNTTVFVGGLSSLISEDTLKTFFAPFGEITYVKIPPGKGCGFVQFVRKADAERSIERLQGFPIGGGRIRLSWGRSQYKAAQAAANAAQLGLGIGALSGLNNLSTQQAASLGLALQGLGGLGGNNANLLRQLVGNSVGGGSNLGRSDGFGNPSNGPSSLNLGVNGISPMSAGSNFGSIGAATGGSSNLGSFSPLSGHNTNIQLPPLNSFNHNSPLNAQSLQALLALSNTGNSSPLDNSSSGMGLPSRDIHPLLAARLNSLSPTELANLISSTNPNRPQNPYSGGSLDGDPASSFGGQSSFTPFSPSQSPATNSSSLPSGNHSTNTSFSMDQEDRLRSGLFPRPEESPKDERDPPLFNPLHPGSSFNPRPSGLPQQSDGFGAPVYSGVATGRRMTSPSAGGTVDSFSMEPRSASFSSVPMTNYSSNESELFGAFAPNSSPGQFSSFGHSSQPQQSRSRAASTSVGAISDLTSSLDGISIGNNSGRSFGYGSFGSLGSSGGRNVWGDRTLLEEDY